MIYFVQILLLIISYLLGGVPWGFVFGKLKGIDIREHGSKNIGATNTGRVLGQKYAILTYLCDMTKGALIVSLFTTGLIPTTYALFNIPIIYGISAIIGHTFTPFLKFKGGKAVATGGGVILAYSPILFALSVIVFFITVYKSKFVSLGSLIAAIFALLGSGALAIINHFYHMSDFYNFYFPIGVFIIALVIFIRHSNNITRLKQKQEYKVSWGNKK